jgi:DNA polymerase III alpha subunit
MYPTHVYVEQAKRQGVRFLLPDVNRSEAEFSIDDDSHGAAVRVGLGRVEGLGPANVQAILDARRRGPFAGLSDCLARARLGRNEARALVLCGAFDWTARSRPTLMMELNLFYALGVWRHSDAPMLLTAGPTIPNVPGDYPPAQKYLQERHILGLSVGEHILAFHRAMGAVAAKCAATPTTQTRNSVAANGAATAPTTSRDAQASGAVTDADSRDLPARVGRIVRIAGMLEAQRTAATQEGHEMMFLTMDDEYGIFEVTLFPDICRAIGGSLGRYGPYVVAGKVEEQYGAVTITAQRVELIGTGPDVDEGV